MNICCYYQGDKNFLSGICFLSCHKLDIHRIFSTRLYVVSILHSLNCNCFVLHGINLKLLLLPLEVFCASFLADFLTLYFLSADNITQKIIAWWRSYIYGDLENAHEANSLEDFSRQAFIKNLV